MHGLTVLAGQSMHALGRYMTRRDCSVMYETVGVTTISCITRPERRFIHEVLVTTVQP